MLVLQLEDQNHQMSLEVEREAERWVQHSMKGVRHETYVRSHELCLKSL